MWKIARTTVALALLAACSGRGTPTAHGPSETAAATPDGDAMPAESPPADTRWQDGYLLAPDSPDPLACDTEADCTCAMLVAEDGCCQPSIWPAPQTRAYNDWLRRHLGSDECRDVECPIGPPPAPPPPCQSKARCFEGRCSTACPRMVEGLSVLLEFSDVEVVREDDGMMVTCQAKFQSLASGPITVRTNFASVFDGLAVVLSGPDGTELTRVPYINHQSPYSSEGSDMELPVGETTQRLVFPLFGFTTDLPVVRVRLEGDLPRVPDSAGLRSEEVDVTIGPAAVAAP
ncbi:MAG: hypothetical protein HY905_13735 [Deltaproteobacteria bacterium]|nr:hypothetical protein [Deltaproteobacteria bacterium]